MLNIVSLYTHSLRLINAGMLDMKKDRAQHRAPLLQWLAVEYMVRIVLCSIAAELLQP